MSQIEILDNISDPGSVNRINEDAFGSNKHSAFVVDGATGLGDRQLMPNAGSDAAWLANHAIDHLTQNLTWGAVIRDAVSDCIVAARGEFESTTRGEPVDRYAWPSASLALAHIDGDNLVLAGLGDCTVYADIAGYGTKPQGNTEETYTIRKARFPGANHCGYCP